MTRFAERLIRGDRVKFFGRWYRLALRLPHPQGPDCPNPQAYAGDPPYDDRLSGRRAFFYDYGPSFPSLADSIFLHSFPDASAEYGVEWPGPNCIDGYFRWEKWTLVNK